MKSGFGSLSILWETSRHKISGDSLIPSCLQTFTPSAASTSDMLWWCHQDVFFRVRKEMSVGSSHLLLPIYTPTVLTYRPIKQINHYKTLEQTKGMWIRVVKCGNESLLVTLHQSLKDIEMINTCHLAKAIKLPFRAVMHALLIWTTPAGNQTIFCHLLRYEASDWHPMAPGPNNTHKNRTQEGKVKQNTPKGLLKHEATWLFCEKVTCYNSQNLLKQISTKLCRKTLKVLPS